MLRLQFRRTLSTLRTSRVAPPDARRLHSLHHPCQHHTASVPAGLQGLAAWLHCHLRLSFCTRTDRYILNSIALQKYPVPNTLGSTTDLSTTSTPATVHPLACLAQEHLSRSKYPKPYSFVCATQEPPSRAKYPKP